MLLVKHLLLLIMAFSFQLLCPPQQGLQAALSAALQSLSILCNSKWERQEALRSQPSSSVAGTERDKNRIKEHPVRCFQGSVPYQSLTEADYSSSPRIPSATMLYAQQTTETLFSWTTILRKTNKMHIKNSNI